VVDITKAHARRLRVVVKGLAEKHIAKAEARALYEDTTPPPLAEEQALLDLLKLAGPRRRPKTSARPVAMNAGACGVTRSAGRKRRSGRISLASVGNSTRPLACYHLSFRPVKLGCSSGRGPRARTEEWQRDTPRRVKAHRQTIKRTAHNRELRSKLRTALKGIRAAIDAGESDRAKALLSETFSIIDKMSNKGIIHDNAAGRYKSRIVKRLRTKASA
jgi:small subunit ribosomal protein S20